MEEQKEALSEREIEILRLVATGAANKEIARQLVISPNTVKVHLRNIFTKIGVASRTEATLYAINNGLVNPSPASIAELQIANPGEPASAEKRSNLVIAEQDFTAKPRTVSRKWQIGLGLLLLLALVGSALVMNRIANQAFVNPTSAVQAQPDLSVAQRWTIKAAMPSPRKGMAFTGYNDSLYLIGGETSLGIDGALLLYEPESDTWMALKDKPTPVTDARAALLGEKIYIPGGRMKDGSPTSVLEIYDPRLDSWERKAPIPIPISAYALASFEGRLYLFGGNDGEIYRSTVYSYDPEEDIWQERSPLAGPRAYAGAAILNNKILIIGGFDGEYALQDNQAYFPNRDSSGEVAWEDFQPLPEERYAMGVTQLGDLIFVFGGLEKSGNAAASSFQFTVPTDLWTEVNPPPVAVGAYPAILASGNYIYLCGGETSGGLAADNQAYQAIYTISVPIIGN